MLAYTCMYLFIYTICSSNKCILQSPIAGNGAILLEVLDYIALQLQENFFTKLDNISIIISSLFVSMCVHMHQLIINQLATSNIKYITIMTHNCGIVLYHHVCSSTKIDNC